MNTLLAETSALVADGIYVGGGAILLIVVIILLILYFRGR